MAVQDILLSEGNDLLIEGGDFVAGESDEQHLNLLMLSNKGEWRQDPAVGVGLRNFLGGPFSSTLKAALAREMRVQFERDEYKVESLEISDSGEVKFNATRQ